MSKCKCMCFQGLSTSEHRLERNSKQVCLKQVSPFLSKSWIQGNVFLTVDLIIMQIIYGNV